MSDHPIGSTAEVFYDIEGYPCTLRQLVVSEPDWAVSRITHERKQFADLEAAIKKVSDYNGRLEARLAAAEADAGRKLTAMGVALLRLLCEKDYENQPEKIDAVNLLFDDINELIDAAIDAARGVE